MSSEKSWPFHIVSNHIMGQDFLKTWYWRDLIHKFCSISLAFALSSFFTLINLFISLSNLLFSSSSPFSLHFFLLSYYIEMSVFSLAAAFSLLGSDWPNSAAAISSWRQFLKIKKECFSRIIYEFLLSYVICKKENIWIYYKYHLNMLNILK